MRLLAVVTISLVLGASTSVGQQYLPAQLTSFANSAGSWTLVAFGLSLLARRWWSGWLFALATFVSLLAGYTVASEIRSYATSTSMWVLWGAAAIVVAPVLGIMGAWARCDFGVGRSVTTGALSGLLIGEGAYGLTVVADTTSPVYWTISIVVGLVGLAWFGCLRRPLAQAALATGITALAGAAFLGAYQLLPGLLTS